MERDKDEEETGREDIIISNVETDKPPKDVAKRKSKKEGVVFGKDEAGALGDFLRSFADG
jgi:hypothetical protein